MKNTLTLMIAIWIFVIQMGSLKGAIQNADNATVNISVSQETGLIEIRVMTPRNTAYRMLASPNGLEWLDIVNAGVVANWSHNGETNETVFVLRRGVNSHQFRIAADRLTGKNVKPFFFRIGSSSLANAWYDFETFFLAEGKMSFGPNFRRRFPSNFKVELIADEMEREEIEYIAPLLFAFGRATNAHFSRRLEEVGAAIDLTLFEQNPEAE